MLFWEKDIIAHAVPLVGQLLDLIDGTFRTVYLKATMVDGELLIARVATPAVTHVVGQHVVSANSGNLLSSSASAGILLQPLVLAIGLLCAWPWQRSREMFLRLVFALPLIAIVTALDVPMILCGLVWVEEINAYDPDRFSPLASWGDFMNAGGRFALTVVAVWLAVRAARWLGARTIRATVADPAPASGIL